MKLIANEYNNAIVKITFANRGVTWLRWCIYCKVGLCNSFQELRVAKKLATVPPTSMESFIQ